MSEAVNPFDTALMAFPTGKVEIDPMNPDSMAVVAAAFKSAEKLCPYFDSIGLFMPPNHLLVWMLGMYSIYGDRWKYMCNREIASLKGLELPTGFEDHPQGKDGLPTLKEVIAIHPQ